MEEEKRHIKYLEKAEKEIMADLYKIRNDFDTYLPTEEKLGRKPNLEDHLKANEVLKNGFNIHKAMDDMIKLEKALSDMHFILMKERGAFK